MARFEVYVDCYSFFVVIIVVVVVEKEKDEEKGEEEEEVEEGEEEEGEEVSIGNFDVSRIKYKLHSQYHCAFP